MYVLGRKEIYTYNVVDTTYLSYQLTQRTIVYEIYSKDIVSIEYTVIVTQFIRINIQTTNPCLRGEH